MTIARVKATGRGRIAARLVVEGLEYEFVSAKRMQRTTSDGRTRVAGLDTRDMKIGARADLMRATLEGTSLTVKVKDLDRLRGKRHGRVTRALWRSPSVRCYLAANLTTSATTVQLRDASGLAESGVVFIGTESIRYESRTDTQLEDCTRGLWGSTAQGHYVAAGEGLSDAAVTDQPDGIEGRRVSLYLYGDGDDPLGDGTLRWRGVCTTDVLWADGVCSFSVDPVTRIFEQPMGGDLSSPVTIRGIHYTSASPWQMQILDADADVAVDATVIGFFETQGEFIEAANAAITDAIADTAITFGDGTLELIEQVGGYVVMYRSDSSDPVRIFATITSQLDFYRDGTPVTARTGVWQLLGSSGTVAWGDRSWPVAAGASYSYTVLADDARASLGRRLAWRSSGADEVGLEADYYRVYLGGLVMPSEQDAISFSTDEEVMPATVTSVDEATRSIVILNGIPDGFVLLDARSEMQLGRRLAAGSFLNVITSLWVSSPSLCNTGAMPLLTGADVIWENDIDDHVATSRLGQGRGFYLFEGGATLAEILTPEMLVCGVYPRLSVDGRVEFFRIRPPLSTDDLAVSIDQTAGTRPAIEKSPKGVLSAVLYRVGYKPREDEWDDRTLTFRDVQSTSATRTPITLEIAQRSTDTGLWSGSGTSLDGVSRDDVARVAVQHLGLFGMPTAVVSIPVDARYMDVLIGQTVGLTSADLPDIEDGCSQIVGRTGLVVATELELYSGRVMLGVLMHTQRFAGYAPELAITSTDDFGGDEWEVGFDWASYSDEPATAWFTAGDLVRVSRMDDATEDVTGTLTTVEASSVVVQFDSTWTPGAHEWVLRVRTSDDQDASSYLARFCYVAGDTRRITFSGGQRDAQVLS